ncbi:unnamed protein product [Gongylonema pulchrum]|uniref:RRM domain-containing protein n=1 Tax=Gongylonema pulchrum TaxID=637853 RepID=A0A183E4R3_9BILA|nr:unnamed protein product [Gongylonema pulchrum]
MEEAVTKIGLRADCASLIWNVYLDFEKMILNSAGDGNNENQRQLVESIYRRLLQGKESDMLRAAFENSAKRMADITAFEDRLADAVDLDEKLSILMEYIEFEMQTKDPVRIQMMFERAVCTSADNPNAAVWLQYGNWLDSSLKLPQVSVEVYARAVRHSPCTALWQQYFTALERSNATADEIDSKWPEARSTITTADEGLSLYRTYIYLLRRRVAKEGGDDYAVVLEKFEEGTTFLAEKFGSHWDTRKIWNDILASGSGHLAVAWLEAANLERYFGELNNARKLYYRAINSASDHPFTVFDALIQFEREVGTLQELDKALEKVNAQAARVSMRPQKSKPENDSKKRKKEKNEEIEAKKKKKEEDQEQKQATNNEVNGVEEPVKSQKKEEASSSRIQVDDDGFVVPQLPAQLQKPEAAASSRTANPPEETNEDTAQARHTVFVSNLDFKLPKEKLEEIFTNAKEVRLVYRGMSKLHKVRFFLLVVI